MYAAVAVRADFSSHDQHFGAGGAQAVEQVVQWSKGR